MRYWHGVLISLRLRDLSIERLWQRVGAPWAMPCPCVLKPWHCRPSERPFFYSRPFLLCGWLLCAKNLSGRFL
jgi:hypothetical protein